MPIWFQTSGTLIGSFFGALIAGIFSLSVVVVQSKISEKRKKKEMDRKITDVTRGTYSLLREVSDFFDEIIDYIDKQSLRVIYLKRQSISIEMLKEELKKLETSLFEHKHYHDISSKIVGIQYRLLDMNFIVEEIESDPWLSEAEKRNKILIANDRNKSIRFLRSDLIRLNVDIKKTLEHFQQDLEKREEEGKI